MNFLYQVRMWGLRIAIGNWLIVFTKKFVGAKRIHLTYKAKLTQKEAGRYVISEDKYRGGHCGLCAEYIRAYGKQQDKTISEASFLPQEALPIIKSQDYKTEMKNQSIWMHGYQAGQNQTLEWVLELLPKYRIPGHSVANGGIDAVIKLLKERSGDIKL